MSYSHRGSLPVLVFFLALACWIRPVSAQNTAFLSTNLENSESTTVIQFAPATGGAVDKIRVQFPAGMLAAGVALREFLIAGKPVKNVTAIIDPAVPNALLIDKPGKFSIKGGVTVLIELLGLINPAAGNHQLDITLLIAGNAPPEVIPSIGLSIAALLAGTVGDITAVNAGTGLTGGSASGDATLAVATPFRLPQGCANGQVAKSNGANTWNCASDNDTNAGGDITAVNTGTGLTGGATSGDVNISILTAFQLPQGCANGQVAKSNGANGWNCAADSNTGGIVTAVTASAPLVSSGGATPNITLSDVVIANTNTAIGGSALATNTGTFNTGLGRAALTGTSGSNNTAAGANALLRNKSGSDNTGTGVNALQFNDSGNNNTAIGRAALNDNTTGSGNTAVGRRALFSNTTGSNNVGIGFDSDVSANNLTNATAIGNGAIVNASNKVRLGNNAVTVIEGQVNFTASSDRNQKEKFRPVDGEEVLRKLREMTVTSWNFIGHDPERFRHYGPMAQDFFAAFGHDGVGQIGSDTTINSGDMAGILMIAVQALEKRTAELIALKAESTQLKARLEEIEQMSKEGRYRLASKE